jgi:hypothetical protein
MAWRRHRSRSSHEIKVVHYLIKHDILPVEIDMWVEQANDGLKAMR